VRVGIAGYGYVGKAVERAIAPPHRAYVYDPPLGYGMPHGLQDCELIFVCVPTPTRPDGTVDTSMVESVVGVVRGGDRLLVVRSTMPAEYAAPPRVVYQPEFIGESRWAPWREETDVGLVVAGGDCGQEVLDFWKPLLGPEVQYIGTDWHTAADIKYAINCHGAVKVAWWTEFLGTCHKPDAVRNAIMSVPWITAYHTLPLGGVGGKCFPKDLAAWAACHQTPIATAALAYLKGARNE